MPVNKNTDANWEKARGNLVDAAEKAGIDPGIMAKIAGFESNYSSTNRPISTSKPHLNTVTQFDGVKAMSSAYGYGQFLNGTWADMVQKYGEKYGVENASKMTDRQANAAELRKDPRLQAAMLAEFTKENIALGKKFGGPDDDANVYALHNLGRDGGEKFLKALKANPDQSVTNLFSAEVISKNPGLYQGKNGAPVTVAEAYERMGKYMDQYEKYALDARKDQPQRTETTTQPDATEKKPAEKTPAKQDGEGTWPAPGNYTLNKKDKEGEGAAGWHSRTGGKHDGVDIQGDLGDPIKAYKGGIATAKVEVDKNGKLKGYGYYIDIQHDDGSVTRYAHLQKDSLNPKPGDKPMRVEEGQVIGKMGRTGNVPKEGDTHLHFELRTKNSNGKLDDVDPMPYLNKAKRDGQTQSDPNTPDPAKSEKAERPSKAMADGVLKQGDRGPEVKAYLENLDKLGYRGPKGESLLANQPEIFGPAAKYATEQFQKAHGLKVDGKAGAVETLPAVEKALKTPLLSEANHPANGYYRNVADQIEKVRPGTDPRVVMNVAKEGIQEGFKDPQIGYSKGQDLFAIAPKPGPGVTPGLQTRVEASVPDASAQTISDRAAVDMKAMQTNATPTSPVPDADQAEKSKPKTMYA